MRDADVAICKIFFPVGLIDWFWEPNGLANNASKKFELHTISNASNLSPKVLFRNNSSAGKI